MATIEVDVDIEDHLDEVSTIDLIDELKGRGGISKALTDNLADEMKLEEFLEKFRDIPQAELTTFLNNYK